MALPSNVDHGTVVGFFEDSFGNALAGSVTFTPQFTVARDASATPKTIILPSPVTAALTQGAFSVLLVATDDPDIGLTTWNYVVTPKFTGPNAPSMSPFPMYVPMGTTTDLADVITVPSTTGALITKGDKGDPGADGVIQSVVAGMNVTVDATDPANPIVNAASGGTTLTSYAAQVQSLDDYPTEFPPDLSAVTPGDIGAQPAGSYQAAGDYATNTALTSGLAGKVPTSRTVAGKPLSANVTLASGDIGDFTTAVDTRVQNVVGAAPAALDTLAELATALGDDANFAGTVTTALATKYVKPGTGIPSTDMTTAVQTSLGKADAALPASGTAAAATKLATARTINGQSFDGTANVVIGADNITTGQLPMAQATPGARFTVLSTAGGWPARPSARTDIFFDWIDMNGLGTNPPGWLDGDSVTKAA